MTTTTAKLDEELFVGSVECTLAAAPGKTFSFTSATFVENNEHNKKEANKFLSPCGFFGEEYQNLILNAVPGLAIVPDKSKQHVLQWTLPLMKSKDTANIVAVGYHSGIRSALIKQNNTWIRLKGCGNMYDQFPLAKVDQFEQYKHCVQIRGCSFEWTCFRELVYADRIGKLMASVGIPKGNMPQGWFEYDRPNDPMPAISRMCGVFTTPGDRRLNDHVLTGLEMLLPLVACDAQQVLQLAPTTRCESAPDEFSSTWWQHVLLGTDATYLDATSLNITLAKDAARPSNVPEKFAQLWSTCVENVSQFSNLFAYLYWRIGREAGAFVKLLHDNQISWGTYSDLIGDHCNAHPNNFLLLPPQSSDTHFLTMVDFDMSFAKEEFTLDEKAWNDNLDRERTAIRMELGGAMANSGTKATINYESNIPLMNLRWSLRDTMLRAFNAAYTGQADEHPVQPQVHANVYNLLRLALMITCNNIA